MSRFRITVALVTLIGLLAGARSAGALDRHWNVGSGVWASSSSWNPAGVPGVSDNAIVDYFPGAPARASVSASSGACTSVTVSNDDSVSFGGSGSLLCGGDFIVGTSNNGGTLSVFNLNPFIVYQGNLTVGGYLRLGVLSGHGLVNQNDGTVAVGASVFVGDSRDPTSSFAGVGTYNIGGGTLRAQQLQVGYVTGAAGTFNLNGGNVNVSTLGLGQGSGAGVFTQNGGTINVTGTAYIGHDPFGFGVGTYTLTGGTFNSAVTYIPAGSVFRYNGGTAKVGQLQIFDGRVELGPGLSNVLRATSLYLRYDNGVIDLSDGGMLLTTGSLGDVQYDLSRGYNGGLWNGNGINSSAAAAARNSAHPTALGYGFDNGVAARYTFYGDANLDRKVDLTDFATLAANFNRTDFNAWPEGDFNYDNHIDLTDFSYLASNFNQSMAAATPGATVPEPAAAVSVVSVLLASVPMRRRRGRDQWWVVI